MTRRNRMSTKKSLKNKSTSVSTALETVSFMDSISILASVTVVAVAILSYLL